MMMTPKQKELMKIAESKGFVTQHEIKGVYVSVQQGMDSVNNLCLQGFLRADYGKFRITEAGLAEVNKPTGKLEYRCPLCHEDRWLEGKRRLAQHIVDVHNVETRCL